MGIFVLANFENFAGQVLLNIEVEQLLLELKLLTAVLDAFLVLVDLEQEQDVVLVDFAVVALNECVDFFLDLRFFAVFLHLGR